MGDFIKALEMLRNIIKTSSFEGLFFTAFILLSVWLFREFRKTKIESDSFDMQRVNAALQTYGKAIISIKKYELKKIEISVLLDDLVMLYPYATKDIIDLINQFILETNTDSHSNIYMLLQKEVIRLKSLQYDSVAFKFNNEYLDSSSFYCKKHNFSVFITPLVNTFIAIMCMLLMILFIFTFKFTDTFSKVIIILLIFGFAFYLFLSMAAVDLITNKRFNNSIINWILFVVLLISPSIFIIHSKWISSITFIMYIAIYMIFIFKKSIVKQN